MVEDALSEELLSGRVKLSDKVRMRMEDGKLCFQALQAQEEAAK